MSEAQATVIISPRFGIETSWNSGEQAPAAYFNVKIPAGDRSEIFLLLVPLLGGRCEHARWTVCVVSGGLGPVWTANQLNPR
jgi:hypothetical protein